MTSSPTSSACEIGSEVDRFANRLLHKGGDASPSKVDRNEFYAREVADANS